MISSTARDLKLLNEVTPTSEIHFRELERAKSLLLKDLAREDLVSFVRHMKASGEKDFMYDPVIKHHLVLYEALQGLADDEFDNLLILMPPGAGKSVLCTVQFPIWYWARNPKFSMLCASNTDSLAKEFSIRRRNCCNTPQYLEIGKPLGGRKGIEIFDNTEGGSMSCHGVGGAIVGRRSNLNMLDDPVLGSEQASSDRQLDKMMTWYDIDFRSRKVKGAKELIVSTRWARRDIAGQIIARAERGEEDWKIIRMPLICDDPATDPMGRELGEVLWPEEFDAKRVKHAKRDNLSFQTTYQQLPYIQDGDWLGKDQLVLKKGIPDQSKMRLIIGADLALTMSGNVDYTVFAVCGLHESGHMHIIEVLRNRHTPDESVKTFFRLVDRFPEAQEVLLDDDNASKVFKELLLNELRHTKKHCKITPVLINMKGLDKETRAANLRTLFHQQRVVIWNKEFTPVLIKELMSFPDGGDHDDMVDALGLVAKRSTKLSTFRSKEEVKEIPSPSVMTDKTDATGRRISNLTLDHLHQDKPQILSIARNRI